jgi:hypothetical protein
MHACCAQLKAECAPEELDLLRRQLEALDQPAFEYDQQYIAECMGWPLPGARASGSGAGAGARAVQLQSLLLLPACPCAELSVGLMCLWIGCG